AAAAPEGGPALSHADVVPDLDDAQLPPADGLAGIRLRDLSRAAPGRLAARARHDLDRHRRRIAGLRDTPPARGAPVSGGLHAYLLLVLVGFLPNEIWRMLGLVAVRGVDEESELFLWARAVATAVLAGVIAKILLFPPGALAQVPPIIRLAAVGCGLVAFLLVRGSGLAGVGAGGIWPTPGALVPRA